MIATVPAGPEMTFLFGYLGSLSTPHDWPVQLMYRTEAAFVVVAFVCILLAMILRRVGTQLARDVVAVVGGVSTSFGLIMPFELAPFFFNARGEIMLATIALVLVYPIAAVLFIFLFRKSMNVTPTRPDKAVPPPLP
jgi:thiosulfate dehydrogenase [quinone] large subunit